MVLPELRREGSREAVASEVNRGCKTPRPDIASRSLEKKSYFQIYYGPRSARTLFFLSIMLDNNVSASVDTIAITYGCHVQLSGITSDTIQPTSLNMM